MFANLGNALGVTLSLILGKYMLKELPDLTAWPASPMEALPFLLLVLGFVVAVFLTLMGLASIKFRYVPPLNTADKLGPGMTKFERPAPLPTRPNDRRSVLPEGLDNLQMSGGMPVGRIARVSDPHGK